MGELAAAPFSIFEKTFYTETLPAMYEVAKRMMKGDFSDLSRALDEQFVQPYNEVKRMASEVFNGKASYQEAYEFGQNLAKVMEGAYAAASLGSAAAVAVKKLIAALSPDLDRKLVAGAGNLDAVIEKGKKITTFLNPADPFRDVFGAGLKSHPEEWNKLIKDLENSGVEVIYRNGTMGYGPLKKGKPGQILIDPEASMSALRHEYSNFLEAKKKGFPSAAESYQDWEGRIADEFKAYSIEIEEAKRLGLDNVAKQLQKNFEEEKQYIIDRFKPRD